MGYRAVVGATGNGERDFANSLRTGLSVMKLSRLLPKGRQEGGFVWRG